MTKKKHEKAETDDDPLNGGKARAVSPITVEERITALEEKIENIIRRNHLLERDR